MKKYLIRLFVIISLIVSIGVIALILNTEKKTTSIAKKPVVNKNIPGLLDLGATKCIPCKMMAPILDELAKEYKGKLNVEFIDVWKNPSAGKKHKIQGIPTQIFFDAKGKEVYRHAGYIPKEEILKSFKITESSFKTGE